MTHNVRVTGLITQLFKEKGSREDLTNWRPISLLYVDYKIIHVDQTCLVAGRSILDNAQFGLLRNVQDYVDQKNLLCLSTNKRRSTGSIGGI